MASEDYNEFENNSEDEKESFVLRSNFSDDPLDEWDIVSYFEQNEKFKQFKPILLLQMQIQNAANYDGNDVNGNENDELDHLLDTMLGSKQNENESSSDDDSNSGDDEMNNNNDNDNGKSFRDYIKSGYMPSPSSLIYDVILSDYAFNAKTTFRVEDEDEKKSPFVTQIDYAQIANSDNFVSISMSHNLKKDDFVRNRRKINCVVILDTRQNVESEAVVSILDELNDKDFFCLIQSDDIECPLQQIEEIENMQSLKSDIESIAVSEDDSFDFDDAYNMALSQLQELYDSQIMAAVSTENEDESEQECENRIIVISHYLPETDSALLDLIQVYCESEENKIYCSFVKIGLEHGRFSKLKHKFDKFRGCNLREYESQSVGSQIKSDFFCIFCPIFLNICLNLKSFDEVEQVYGFGNNLKKIKKLNEMGIVSKRKNLFFEEAESANESVIVVKMNEKCEKIEIELKYEDDYGKNYEFERSVSLSKHKEGIVDGDSYFDNVSIRKRILLIKFGQLLNEWMATDVKNANLNVSDEYKVKFEAFLKVFKEECEHIEDDLLNQEVEIMEKLIAFNEEDAEKLRADADV